MGFTCSQSEESMQTCREVRPINELSKNKRNPIEKTSLKKEQRKKEREFRREREREGENDV